MVECAAGGRAAGVRFPDPRPNMERREQLQITENKITQELISAREEWVDHMQLRHNGRRAASCHQCIVYDYTVRADEYLLGQIRQELAEIQNSQKQQ